jgi:hypothetical protein
MFSYCYWRLGMYFKECWQDKVGIHLARVYDFVTTTCAKAFVTDLKVTVPAPNVLMACVFGTDIFH